MVVLKSCVLATAALLVLAVVVAAHPGHRCRAKKIGLDVFMNMTETVCNLTLSECKANFPSCLKDLKPEEEPEDLAAKLEEFTDSLTECAANFNITTDPEGLTKLHRPGPRGHGRPHQLTRERRPCREPGFKDTLSAVGIPDDKFVDTLMCLMTKYDTMDSFTECINKPSE